MICTNLVHTRLGSHVRLKDSFQGCQEILDGIHDDLPVESFYFTGAPISPNPGEGLLTEPTPAVRSWSRERVFMPHTCPSQYPSGLAQGGGRLSFVSRHRLVEVCQFRRFDAKRSL
jgi:hypothetical protein